VRTSPFRKQDRQYSRSMIVPLLEPTADTHQLVQAALLRGLQAIYRPGYNYAKAGVMLLGLQSNTVQQGTLDLGDRPVQRTELMSALDSLNDRYGRGSIGLASAGIQEGAAQLGDEAGAGDTAVHDQVGGYAGGQGLVTAIHRFPYL
jgi:DNA polymerase V